MLEGSLDAAHQDPSTFIRFGPSVAHEESTKICADLFFLPNRLTIHHKWVILCFLRPMYNKKNFQQGSIVQDLCQSTGGIPPQKAKVLQISSYSTQTLRLTLCSRGVHNRKWMPPQDKKLLRVKTQVDLDAHREFHKARYLVFWGEWKTTENK